MAKKGRKFSLGSFFKKYYKYIFLIIGIAGMVAIFLGSDPTNIQWESFASAEFGIMFAECIGVWFVIYVLHTLTYKIILKEESKKIDIPHLFKITMTGFALNNVTPAGLVGGEPYRIMELKKYCSTEKSASATFSFTILYAIGHLLLWDAGTIVYLCYGLPGSTFVDILLLVTGGFNLIATFCLIFLRINMVYPIMRFLTKLPIIGKWLKPMVERKKDTYIEIDNLMQEFRRDWFRFGIVLIIQFTTRLLEAFEYFLIIRFCLNVSNLNVDFTYFDGLMVMATCSLVGNLIFIIPMQAGSREGGLSIALNFLFDDAVVSELLVPVGLIYRFREFICTSIGIIMVAATRRNKKAIAEVEKREAEMLAAENAENETNIIEENKEENKIEERNEDK